mmetsp:Transcript_159283/g.511049  ORF Transcript_159283/g.511049 Transcript_159283/m.511049 type:complete len:246 (+) Transcript_159283:162-899(+)
MASRTSSSSSSSLLLRRPALAPTPTPAAAAAPAAAPVLVLVLDRGRLLPGRELLLMGNVGEVAAGAGISLLATIVPAREGVVRIQPRRRGCGRVLQHPARGLFVRLCVDGGPPLRALEPLPDRQASAASPLAMQLLAVQKDLARLDGLQRGVGRALALEADDGELREAVAHNGTVAHVARIHLTVRGHRPLQSYAAGTLGDPGRDLNGGRRHRASCPPGRPHPHSQSVPVPWPLLARGPAKSCGP